MDFWIALVWVFAIGTGILIVAGIAQAIRQGAELRRRQRYQDDAERARIRADAIASARDNRA